MNTYKSFDRVADVYDSTRGLPANVSDAIADGIASALGAPTSTPNLLEVGIGTGRMAVPLAQRGVAVTGIDISPAMLSVLCEKRSDIRVMLAESGSPPFRLHAFDAALFVHILHLVPDAAAAVRAVLPLVRSAGAIIYGADEVEEGIRSKADLAIRRTVKEIAGVELSGWKPYDESRVILEAIVEHSGAIIGHRDKVTWSASTSARRMLERLERKDFSSSWMIPDADMPAILERAGPRLEELFGGVDRNVEFSRSFLYTVWRLP